MALVWHQCPLQIRINAVQRPVVSKATVGHGAVSVLQMVNGAIQPKHIHKVLNMFHANTIRIVMGVGNVLDRVRFKLKLKKTTTTKTTTKINILRRVFCFAFNFVLLLRLIT